MKGDDYYEESGWPRKRSAAKGIRAAKGPLRAIVGTASEQPLVSWLVRFVLECGHEVTLEARPAKSWPPKRTRCAACRVAEERQP